MKNSIIDAIEKRLETNTAIALATMWGITGAVALLILITTGVI